MKLVLDMTGLLGVLDAEVFSRAVARFENPGGLLVLGGDNVPPPPG